MVTHFKGNITFYCKNWCRNGSETDAPPLHPIYHKSFLQQHVDNTSNAGKVCPWASAKLLSAHDFLQRIQTRLKVDYFQLGIYSSWVIAVRAKSQPEGRFYSEGYSYHYWKKLSQQKQNLFKKYICIYFFLLEEEQGLNICGYFFVTLLSLWLSFFLPFSRSFGKGWMHFFGSQGRNLKVWA